MIFSGDSVFLGSFGAMSKAFLPPVKAKDELITRMVELAGIARKDGMMVWMPN